MNSNDIASALRQKKLVVMKSDTIYGVFASAKDQEAVNRLHAVRGREQDQGFIILVDSVNTVADIVRLSDQVRHRLENIWAAPFATSVILSSKDTELPWLSDTRSGKPTICFRIPNDVNLRGLVEQTGPLCAPSANLPDQLPARNIKEAESYFGRAVDTYIDGGECDNNLPSRVIRFSSSGTVETVRPDGHSHPEDFIITRRRKLYKFARFDEMDTCFHFDEWLIAKEDKLRSAKQLVVEVGAGSALFSVELALRNPDITFVAIDIKGDRLYQGAREASRLGVDNIYFVRSDISKITEAIPPHLASQIWITFPDPYPRKSDRRHRLTAQRYLEYYKQILKPEGILNFKTDSLSLFKWSLVEIENNGWECIELTRDLHSSDTLADAKIMTSYEKRFVDEGLKINFAQFRL